MVGCNIQLYSLILICSTNLQSDHIYIYISIKLLQMRGKVTASTTATPDTKIFPTKQTNPRKLTNLYIYYWIHI